MTLLDGKRVIVSGGGSGIGRETADAVNAGGRQALALEADVRNERQVQAAVAHAVDAWGGLDVVLGCAGVHLAGQDDRADRLSLEAWQRTIDINLTGMFLLSKHGIRALLDGGGGGTVVLVCSPTGLFGCAPGYDAYSSSKAGVYGLVRVLAADYAQDGIRVNGVVPGYTRSPMTAWVTPEEHADLLETIPLRRAGEPVEVAEVIAFLASERTPYTTGAVWAADGGMTAI